MYQPYESHLRRSSSEVISGIASKVGGTMLGVVLPALVMVSSVLLLLAITAALLVVDAWAALIAAVGFGGSYGLVTWFTKKALLRNAQHISVEQTQVVKALQEGLGGIRDVLLDGTQQFYCDLYAKADRILRRAQGTNVFIAQIPRPPIEAFGMVLIAGLAYGLSQRPGRCRFRLAGARGAGAGRAATLAGPSVSLCLVGEHRGQPAASCRTRWRCWISPCRPNC